MSNLVRQYRFVLRLSQADLAIAVGVSRQSITSLEVGKYKPSLDLAFKIAKFFGTSIENIFYP